MSDVRNVYVKQTYTKRALYRYIQHIKGSKRATMKNGNQINKKFLKTNFYSSLKAFTF